MSLVKAYHAGELEEIDCLISQGFGIRYSSSQGNWLGEGVYFWENDPVRAEEWQIQRNKGAILECEIDTSFLLNLLVKNEHTAEFYDRAGQIANNLSLRNQKNAQKFDLDNQVFKKIQETFSQPDRGLCGVRMAFYLGQSITPDGNIYENQHIQICLWDLSAAENPRKYTAGLSGLI
ncbi:MAG: hypothetical protein PHE55_19500 [Methylococcaceae bacterium]|nr:hypothetical protein [Methylococcaceae bacterium]